MLTPILRTVYKICVIIGFFLFCYMYALCSVCIAYPLHIAITSIYHIFILVCRLRECSMHARSQLSQTDKFKNETKKMSMDLYGCPRDDVMARKTMFDVEQQQQQRQLNQALSTSAHVTLLSYMDLLPYNGKNEWMALTIVSFIPSCRLYALVPCLQFTNVMRTMYAYLC